MTDKELLNCLTDRPCAVCKFHEEKGCTEWDCVFDQREQEPKTEHCEDCVNREFIEIVVNYPPADLCTYPEYRGKPYFSIKYRENGKEYIGYGTYKIEMLSQWIKQYFMSDNQPKSKIDTLDKIRAEIEEAVWEDVVVSLDGADETRIPRLDPDDVFEIIDKYRGEK